MRISRIVITVLILALALGVAVNLTSQTASAQSPKLDEIRARGQLNCGVGGSLPGFSNPNPDTGRMEGMDADYCRALAVAIFGADYTEDSVVFIPLTADVRFTALQSNQVDVLIRNTTWTLTRDITLGGDFAPTIFYDGQGLLVRVADGYTSLADMEGVTICTTSGTTTEKNITDAYRAQFGADPTLAFAEGPTENLADFEAGVCDVMTSDKSQLAGLRSVASDPSSLAILPDTLSKEPLGPMYLSGDPVFADVVNWTVYATFQAEELGITSANVDEMMSSEDIQVQRFLGLTEDNFGAALGLSNSFAADIIRTVGNYGEIYERNITPIGVPREGSLNALWRNGGLIYSPAWR
jgi:general L-amino acid transport system substrate-binding protein